MAHVFALAAIGAPFMRKLFAALVAAFASVCAAAHAYDYSPAAQRVLNQARAASGGEGWNSLRGWEETGRWGELPYRILVDPIRYGMRIEIREAGGQRLQGFNGAGEWEISSTGVVTGVDDKFTVAQARTTAFFAARGYFFPGRFAARGTHLGVRKDQGRSFDVLTITPAGGVARELWFDRATHLLSRVVDPNGRRPMTMELSDYRRAGRIMAPLRVVIDDGESGRKQVRIVESVTFAAPDRDLFSLPRALSAAPPSPPPPPPKTTAPSAARK